MQIVVVDNEDWIHFHGAGIVPAPYCISTSDKTSDQVYDELVCCFNEWGEDHNIYYLINIHCVFKNPPDPRPKIHLLQNQSGVSVYRLLLKAYNKEPRNLKVGFFSPIPIDLLIKLMPQNYVIILFPFFESPFKWEDCLKKLTGWEHYPVFNVSSENLLSGFKLLCSEVDGELNTKVACGSKKILFIDDQASEWEATFKEIFKIGTIINLPYKSQLEFRNNFLNRSNSDFIKIIRKELESCDIVLSDFYLVEDHDPEKWMDKTQITNISGFQLYNEIKELDKGVPVIMHTSSNKIPYYKVFDYFGVDNWIVKDSRVNSTSKEKRDSFILFKETIQSIIQNDIYQKLRKYWNEIIIVEKTGNNKWWYSTLDNPPQSVYWNKKRTESMTFQPLREYQKTLVVQLLKSSWFAIRRMLNKELGYEEHNEKVINVFKQDHFTAAAVCNNLGKIIEILGVKAGIPGFSLLTNFLLLLRNTASHSNDYELLESNDALIYLNYILSILNNNASNEEEFKSLYPDRKIEKGFTSNMEDIYPFALFWLYLQFYNYECSKRCLPARIMMLNRLKKLFVMARDSCLIQPVLLSNAKFVREYTLEKKGITNYEYSDANNQFKINVPKI